MSALMTRFGAVLGVNLLFVSLSFSQGSSSPPIDYETARLSRIVTAVRITEDITLDGRLQEASWKLAEPASDFTQWQPLPGEPASVRTEVRFLYDSDNLYVGFINFDPDVANTIINDLRKDFNNDATDGVNLMIDSLHDGRSGFLFNTNPAGAKRDTQSINNSSNANWDGVWDVKTTINEEDWIAEFRIPFKTLRFTNSPSQEWGVNMARKLLRKNETSYWSPIPVRFRITNAELAGTLRGLEGIRQGLNVYVKPFVIAGVSESRTAGGDSNFDGGVDLKYSLTPSLTMDATYRTDFAQVEVDQQQVNLTRFNLFFPEKRGFFLENSGIFAFGGNAETGGELVPFFSRRIGLSPSGTPIPIVGGTRVTGRVGRYDVGLLAMKTEHEGVIPSNNYLVGRLKRNLFSNSWIGGLATSRQSTADGDTNRVYGADAHFRFYDRLELDTYLLKSTTPGRTNQDAAKKFQAAWRDDELTLSGTYNTIQPNFNPEVGFVRRSDYRLYAGEFSWNPLIRSSDSIRNLRFGATLDYYESVSTDQIETRNPGFVLGVLFQNNSQINFNIDQTFDRLGESQRILGLPLAAGDYRYLNYSLSGRSNPASKFAVNSTVTWGEFWNGQRKSFSGGVGLRPDYHLSLEANYSHNRVTLPNGKATTDLVGARIDYAFSPRTFFNAFVQYNAASHQVSSNLRFNFIHHPLSDFYVVYNDLRDTDNGELVERALIVKVTNLFTF